MPTSTTSPSTTTQGIIDAIFGPHLKVVETGARAAAVGNPSRQELLKRIENMPPDAEYHRERRTARMSFAFTERERNLFTHAFLEIKKGTRPKGVPPNLMTKDQFAQCWETARQFAPSAEVVETVSSLFLPHPKHTEYIIDAVDFTRACSLDIESAERVPFAVSFTKETRERYDGIVELMYMVPFVVLLSVVLITFRSLPTGYQVHQAVADNVIDRRFLEPCTGLECSERAQRVLTFRDITEPAYFYEWLRAQVTPTIWVGTGTDDADKRLNQRLLPIGALRIQQYRIDSVDSSRRYAQLFTDSSPTPDEQAKINTHYSPKEPAFTYYPAGPESSDNEIGGWSQSPFNLDVVRASGAPQYIQDGFTYTEVEECGDFIRGFVNNYKCAGHLVNFPLNLTKDDVISGINQLENMSWIDDGTRFVAIRAVFFNKDYQMFSRLVAGFEVPSGGHWLRIFRSNIFRFFTLSQQSVAYIFFFVLFLTWLAWNILSFLVELTESTRASARALGRPFSSAFDHGAMGFFNFLWMVIPRSLVKVYIKDGWLFIDSLNYALFIVVWFWRAQVWTEYQTFDTLQNRVYPSDLEKYAGRNASIDYLESVVIILCYFRILKNLRSFPILRLIFKSLYAASGDLLGMAFTAAILIVAFALSGFVAYGALIPDFSSVVFALVTVLRFIIGDYDYDAWESAQNVLAPFYYAMLQVLLVVIVLEFITAIIADTFGDLSREQYRADHIRHVIEADLQSMLTADVVDSPIRSPIAMEFGGYIYTVASHMKYFYRFFHYYLCAKKAKDMTPEELKEEQHRRQYEDPPVDSALYILDAASRRPQHLNMVLELLIQRTYVGKNEDAAEALFLLYEMLFELESRDDIRGKITRQLMFTLAASHCKTTGLTKLLESSSTSLVTALINRLGPNKYPFLVAVGVHLPHAVSRLPRVTRFVNLFEAHAEWSHAVRNESVVHYESSQALSKLKKIAGKAEELADVHDSDNEHEGPDNGNSNITSASTSNNNNLTAAAASTSASSPMKFHASSSSSKGRALLEDPSNVSRKSAVSSSSKQAKQQQQQQLKDEKLAEKKEAQEKKQCLTTEQQQSELEDTETMIMDNLRFRALFSGIRKEAVTSLFHGWNQKQRTEKLASITAFRLEWERIRTQWISEGIAETVDLEDEGALLFGSHKPKDDSNNNAPDNNKNNNSKNRGSPDNNNNDNNDDDGQESEIDPDEADGAFDITKLSSDRRTGAAFDVVEFFDTIYEDDKYQKLIDYHSDRIYTQGWTDRKRKQFRTLSATYLQDYDPVNKKSRSAGSHSPSPDAPASPLDTTTNGNTNYDPLEDTIQVNAALNFQAVKFLKNKSLPLKAFKAIWKKIVGADLSEDFLIKLRELNEMTTGTSNNKNMKQQQQQQSSASNEPASVNANGTNAVPDNDEDENVSVDAGLFQRYCVISPEAHSRVSIASHYYKSQHEMLYNTVQLILYIPFVVFFTLLLVLSQNDLGTYSSVTVKDYATRNYKSPEMREFTHTTNTDQWRNWVSQDIFDQFLSTTDGVPFLNFTGYTFLVGGIRIRQLRIQAVDDCGFPDPGDLPSEISSTYYQRRKSQFFPDYCVPRWNVGFEETGDMLKNTTGLSDAAVAAFSYKDGSCFGFQNGVTGYFSTCSGYTLFINASSSRQSAQSLLDEVMPIWVDASTRALVVDFFAYNFNDNIYVRNLFLAETTAGGGWHFSVRQDPFRLFTFSPIGSSSLTWIIVMCLFIIVYIGVFGAFIVRTISDVRYVHRRLSCSTFTAFMTVATWSIWWVIELVTYLLIAGSLCTRFFFMTASTDTVRVYRDEYPENLQSYAEASYAIILMDAYNTFLVYIRIFFFVRLHGKLNVLPKTLEKAAGYMLSILVISIIVLIAFALAGHVVYGSTVYSMATVSRSLKTLTLTIFEQGDFDNWLYDKPVWTSVYYTLFTVVCVQILFNMVTSVLARAYSDAKDERFDASELRHVSNVDSTIIATKALFPSLIGIFAKEIRYRAFYFVRLYEQWMGKPNVKRKRQLDVLRNPFTFYRFMDESLTLFEQGSPRQCGIASGNLVLTMALLRNEDKLTSVLQKRWNRSVAASSKSTGVTNLSVFGIKRPSLLGYVVASLPAGYFDEVYYWCVQTPMFFLNLSPADAVERLLESHSLWTLSADKYLELENDTSDVKVKDAEERDEQLGELVANLTRSVNKVIKKYKN